MLLLVTTEDEMYEKLYHTRLFWYLSSIHVYTENEINPKRIFIDFRTIANTGSYRIGNLEYILPKGMSINREKHPDLNFPIVKVNRRVSIPSVLKCVSPSPKYQRSKLNRHENCLSLERCILEDNPSWKPSRTRVCWTER